MPRSRTTSFSAQFAPSSSTGAESTRRVERERFPRTVFVAARLIFVPALVGAIVGRSVGRPAAGPTGAPASSLGTVAAPGPEVRS